MRFASCFLFSSAILTCCVASSFAQAATPDGSPTAISADVPDSHEAQSTTRSVSQIRIVRLSQVRGEVQLDRSTGQRFEAAFPNLPIISGEQLRTQQGVAEVEFEDNSSLRLVTDSQIDFPTLGRKIDGTTTTTVNLVRGGLYVSMAGGKPNGDFILRVGRETLTLSPSSHLRVEIAENQAKVDVFQGTVTAANDGGTLVVGKHKAISFDPGSEVTPVFAKLDEPSPFDEWDKNAVDYHKTLAVAASYANSPFSYGVNDLAYYGAFADVAGCGSMWRPYLAPASFDPYASGIWTWYPTSGYSWVSPYPWGWTPFHSGSWNYCGGGWGWQPQGGWNGLQNVPATTQQIRLKVPGHSPVHAPLPPVVGHPTFVGVNLAKLPISKPGAGGESFVFQGGSAGLGVPRGVFHNLGKMSQHATQHGFATSFVSETQAARSLMPTASLVASVNHMQPADASDRGSFRSVATNRGAPSISNAHSSAASAGASMNSSASSSFASSAHSFSSVSSAAPVSSGGGSAKSPH